MKFDYEKAEFETVPCNLCGKADFFVLSKRAANGRKTRTCLCKNCGLIFINPRMTKAWYDIYYKNFYREDRKLSRGHSDKAEDLDLNFKISGRFGDALGARLKNFLLNGLTLDIGSSTGGTLFGLKESVSAIEIYGIEPSLKESEYARRKGVETYQGLFENFTAKNQILSAANILCVRSLNHLLNPRRFFEWSWGSLKEGGNLILYVKNFRYQARRAGSVEAGVQIDHPYMFTPEALKYFVESIGFNVVHLEDDEKKTWTEIFQQKKEGLSAHHILIVAKKNNNAKKTFRAADGRKNYLKTRLQLTNPYLKLYYLAAHSGKTKFLRKLLS